MASIGFGSMIGLKSRSLSHCSGEKSKFADGIESDPGNSGASLSMSRIHCKSYSGAATDGPRSGLVTTGKDKSSRHPQCQNPGLIVLQLQSWKK